MIGSRKDPLVLGGPSVSGWAGPWLGGGDALLVVGLFAILPLEHTQALRHLLAAMLGARGLWLLAGTGDGSFLRRCWVVLPWAAWASLSYFWSVAPETTLSNLKHDLWTPLLAMLGCHQIFRHRCPPRVLLAAVAVGSVSNALVTLSGAPASPLSQDLGRYYFSTVGYSSTYALCFAALALPWALGAGGPAFRVPALAVVVLNGAAALVTQNRMFFVAAALLLLLLPWLARDLRRRTVYGLVTVAVILAGTFLVLNQGRTESQVTGLGVADGLAHVVRNEVRYDIWRHWAGRAAAGPVLGTGFGRDVPPLTIDRAERDALQAMDRFAAMHSHNLFLNVRVELGWPGLLLYLLLLAGAVRQFLAARSKAALAASSGLLLIGAVVLKNQTDVFMVFSPAVLFYASLGSVSAWLDGNRSSS